MSENPPRGSFAWYRDKSDRELKEMLAGGPLGNRDVDSARAELDGRWNRRAFWAAVAAALFAAIGVLVAVLK